MKNKSSLLNFAALLVGRSRDRFPVVSLGIFSVVPPTEPCILRSTQPLQVSTRDFFWGKGGRCVWPTTYHPCNAETSRKSRALTYPKPLGTPQPVAGDFYIFFLICEICGFRSSIDVILSSWYFTQTHTHTHTPTQFYL